MARVAPEKLETLPACHGSFQIGCVKGMHMTFQQYIQSLQDQFIRDGGLSFTEDVCQAVACCDYQKPKYPFCSHQLDLVGSWFRVNTGTNEAEKMEAKGKSDFVPMVKRGIALKKKLLTIWDKVKDQPNQNAEELAKGDPTSKPRKLYDAVRAIESECEEFNNLMGVVLQQEIVISNHYKKIRMNQDGNDMSFSIAALQRAIDKTLDKKPKVKKKDLRECLCIKSPTTFNKHLDALNLDDDQLDSAMRGETRLE